MTPVRVTWADSHSVEADGWLMVDNLDDGPCVVRTVGWLLTGAKAGHVSVALSEDENGMVRDVFHIPVGMVVELAALDGTGVILGHNCGRCDLQAT